MNIFLRYVQVFRQARPYSLYVLMILLVVYMINQLDRYALSVVAQPMAQDIHFGDKSCMSRYNSSFKDYCKDRNESACEMSFDQRVNESDCKNDYNGKGYQYQLVAGPIFILIFTIMGVFISYFADSYRSYRVYILGACLIWWSSMTVLTGFVQSYWELALLRFGLGLGEAGCNPIATGLITDFFSEELRGSALGIYNWGIYTGYSMAIAIGNPILLHLGWRWVYIIAGIPGLAVGVVVILSIREPKKLAKDEPKKDSDSETDDNIKLIETQYTMVDKLRDIGKIFCKPTLILLLIASSIRNGAGYTWGYNYAAFYKDLNQTPTQIASWLGWVPIVGGLTGSFVGGFVSDRIVKKSEPYKRIWVLVLSQIGAVPFLVGVLLLPPPYSYISLIPAYILGEMWVGVCLSVMVELIPERLRNTGVGLYFFIISNIGGNMPILLPPLEELFQKTSDMSELSALRGALFILYPGAYVISSILFLLTLFSFKSDYLKAKNSILTAQSSSFANPLVTESEPDEK